MPELDLTKAIEAGAIVLGDGPKWFYEYPNNDRDRDRYRKRATEILTAALPHIREQLAQEIEAGMLGELRKMHNLDWSDGMETAAKIVEGP